MPNDFFRFRAFTIQQGLTSMKVCTDSCILGAWTATHLGSAARILDIGTGTGLLPLILAQKTQASIDGIELDPAAARQAAENISAASLKDRIHVIEGDVNSHPFPAGYDFIISNPPFFDSDLRSPDEQKNRAKHDESLTLAQWVPIVRGILNPAGSFTILLPFLRTNYFEDQALRNGFFLQEKMTIRQSPTHIPFRTVCLYKRTKAANVNNKTLSIRALNGKYSTEFQILLEDLYQPGYFQQAES